MHHNVVGHTAFGLVGSPRMSEELAAHWRDLDRLHGNDPSRRRSSAVIRLLAVDAVADGVDQVLRRGLIVGVDVQRDVDRPPVDTDARQARPAEIALREPQRDPVLVVAQPHGRELDHTRRSCRNRIDRRRSERAVQVRTRDLDPAGRHGIAQATPDQ